YSAMNAGKSTALLQSSYNYQERGMRTVVYTAEIDYRFGAGKVSSRIGLSSPARLYNTQTSLFDDIEAEHQLKPIHCVLVDE
ncbi:thymidine kinase, partial [Klebsiella pneumoniae]|nr:thymidine kinase [Klebsiella pneumoniae]